MVVRLLHGDCRQVMADLERNSVDAVVTDPPYDLTQIGRTLQFKSGSVDEQTGHLRSNLRTAGFMGMAWDGTGVAFTPATWAEALSVLKPGGHLVAFGGTRTFHRLTCAIEDAGFEIRDCLSWLYGCLSDDTEVLTDEGWVQYHKANEGQRALAFDPSTGLFAWQAIRSVFRYWHDGEMVRLQSPNTDQLLTPNHRVILDDQSTCSTPYVGSEDDIDYLPGLRNEEMADQLVTAEGPDCILQSEMQRDRSRSGVGATWIQGGDGGNSARPSECNHQNDRVAQPRMEGRRYRVQEARQLCRSAVCQVASVGDAYGSQGRLPDGASTTDGGPVRLSDGTNRSSESREPRSDRQSSGEPDALAEQSGSQAVRMGQVPGRYALPSTAVTASWVDYAGVVWCINVPSGAFLARRNGQIFVTGNSGFPKSLDVSKAIDKAAGVTREVIGHKVDISTGRPMSDKQAAGGHNGESSDGWDRPWKQDGARLTANTLVTAPATYAAREWDGWGTALKPAWEPIILARKPLSEKTVAANVLRWGTGALNVDGCRIEGSVLAGRPDSYARSGKGESGPWHGSDYVEQRTVADRASELGRWPANVCLDEEATALLDEQSGTLTSGANPTRRDSDKFRGIYAAFASKEECEPARGVDVGGASRFFYTAKASQAERNERVRQAGSTNTHPTVKPVDLMRWLCRMVTPPGGMILDPFVGSGTTLVAAILEGFDAIGIDQSSEYIELARKRVDGIQIGGLIA